jgi:hypothetical protein
MQRWDEKIFGMDLSYTLWSPADYLDSKYTFIEDYSNVYINTIKNAMPSDISVSKNPTFLLKAGNACSLLTQDTNYKANMFNMYNAFSKFVILVACTLLVFMLPVGYGGYKLWRHYFPPNGTNNDSTSSVQKSESDTNNNVDTNKNKNENDVSTMFNSVIDNLKQLSK